MELNERKINILYAIISDYLNTAEPVGSRTISKNYDLGISPATIRNEMSDLEELGYILQPHTSSGRIPSDKGYRLYVDVLLQNQRAEMKKITLLEELVQRADRLESLLQDIAKLIARETHYATMISTPQNKCAKLKNIQLIGLEPRKILAVVITDSNAVKNYMIDVKDEIQQNVLNRLSFVLNEHLLGLSIEDIDLPLIQSISKYTDHHTEVVSKILDIICQTIQTADETDIITSGTTNILKFPEFNDVNKAMELIDAFEEKGALKNILSEIVNHNDGRINIWIGDEIKIEEMKECSLITSAYSLGNDMVGAIGIIGPKRMDYMNTISVLKYLINHLERKIKKRDKGS